MRRSKPGSKTAVRSAARFLKVIAAFNEELLGKDESAARVRRYVARHEMPSGDRAAFSRLCDLILSQRVGLAAVERERQALEHALGAFDPASVASLDIKRVGICLSSTALRDMNKFQMCISAAKSWCQAAEDGAYVTRLARVAADDDALHGWPALVTMIRRDFAGINNAMATALLKRWGFFTAATHLGAQRLLSRLGLIDAGDRTGMQVFLTRVADASNLTPYAAEGTIAIFAGIGPCRERAQCDECPLSGRCPSSSIC